MFIDWLIDWLVGFFIGWLVICLFDLLAGMLVHHFFTAL
jgi:hypothetical protein